MISTGYFPYAQYVRDYNPPPTPMMHPGGGQGHPESPMYSTIPSKWPQNLQQSATSVLNVADPRYSAAYGNPLLRQVISIIIAYCILFCLLEDKKYQKDLDLHDFYMNWTFPRFSSNCYVRRKARDILNCKEFMQIQVVLIFFFPLV